jgi:hypothetical protein
MSTTDARSRLHEIKETLSPETARARAVAQLDDLFKNGSAPVPPPDGFLRGSAITSTIWSRLDSLGGRLARLYMPWLGKSFDASTSTGVNVLDRSALKPIKALWPGYRVIADDGDRVDAFRFKTRTAPGAVDPVTTVLKIDYDSDENPDLIIRRILDELTQIEEGLYLGKVLFRSKTKYHAIGFFTLER